MDWIEEIFGIDPDMGSGSLEILIMGAIVLVVVGFIVYVRRRSGAREKVR